MGCLVVCDLQIEHREVIERRFERTARQLLGTLRRFDKAVGADVVQDGRRNMFEHITLSVENVRPETYEISRNRGASASNPRKFCPFENRISRIKPPDAHSGDPVVIPIDDVRVIRVARHHGFQILNAAPRPRDSFEPGRLLDTKHRAHPARSRATPRVPHRTNELHVALGLRVLWDRPTGSTSHRGNAW